MEDSVMREVARDQPTSPLGGSVMGKPKRLQQALRDLVTGTTQWWVWGNMAWQDIRRRYRGSVLGPFWLTLSMAIMVGTLGILYSAIFNEDIHTYLPYIAVGLLFWTFISSMISEGCNCFIEAETVIRQVQMPFTMHVCRTLYRNLIVLAHNSIVYLVVLFWFRVPLTAGALLVVPGMALLLLNGMWACILLGMICARFRDVVPIIGSILQIIFFGTPIFWLPSALGSQHRWLADFNPFYSLLEIVRAPLLGQPQPQIQWAVVSVITILGWTVTLPFFARFRARIPFWL